MEHEIWKPVDGFEGLYEISNLGRIKSLNYHREGVERILKPQKHIDGYLKVNLYRDGKMKTFSVHRLVAMAFLPNPEGLPEINHRDEVKTNNCVENIEWCSSKYNMNYGTLQERIAAALSKPVEASKYEDFRKIELRFDSTAEAERNGYSKGAVSSCCNWCYSTHRGNFYKNLYWRFAC